MKSIGLIEFGVRWKPCITILCSKLRRSSMPSCHTSGWWWVRGQNHAKSWIKPLDYFFPIMDDTLWCEKENIITLLKNPPWGWSYCLRTNTERRRWILDVKSWIEFRCKCKHSWWFELNSVIFFIWMEYCYNLIWTKYCNVLFGTYIYFSFALFLIPIWYVVSQHPNRHNYNTLSWQQQLVLTTTNNDIFNVISKATKIKLATPINKTIILVIYVIAKYCICFSLYYLIFILF